MEDRSNIIKEAIEYRDKLEKEVIRLRTIISEIKKIAELPSYHSKLIFNEFESRLYKIIDIINKAESEG